MTEGRRIKVEVKDKRKVNAEAAADPEVPAASAEAAPQPDGSAARPAVPETDAAPANVTPANVTPEERDYLDDLRRLQADFDNYRKRMMREQAEVARRASARTIERLLPVLDNFERAISHGEGGEGVAMVYNELKGALESEGLEEIPAEGVPFDPRVHEAMSVVEDPDVQGEVTRTVVRRGYRVGDAILRPAMVVVARSAAGDEGQEAPAPDVTVDTGAEAGEA